MILTINVIQLVKLSQINQNDKNFDIKWYIFSKLLNTALFV
jgi:hypothetical protein